MHAIMTVVKAVIKKWKKQIMILKISQYDFWKCLGLSHIKFSISLKRIKYYYF